MSRTLRNPVHVIDPETGAGVWLQPNTEVPGWAHKAITNPKAWNADPDDAESPSDSDPGKAPAANTAPEPVKAARAPRKPKAEKSADPPEPAPPGPADGEAIGQAPAGTPDGGQGDGGGQDSPDAAQAS